MSKLTNDAIDLLFGEIASLEAELEQRIGQIARMEIRKHELEAELKAKDEELEFKNNCIEFCGICDECKKKCVYKEPGQSTETPAPSKEGKK